MPAKVKHLRLVKPSVKILTRDVLSAFDPKRSIRGDFSSVA